MTQTANELSFSDWAVAVTALITCQFSRHDGLIILDLRSRYSYTSSNLFSDALESGDGYFGLLPDNNTGLYWAWALLFAFWVEMATAIDEKTTLASQAGVEFPWKNLSTGYLSWSVPSSLDTDIQSRQFLPTGESEFLALGPNARAYGTYNASSANKEQEAWPELWAPAERLAKAMLSTVHADFGQTHKMSPGPSMISSTDSLSYWTSNFTRIYTENDMYAEIATDLGLPITDYATFRKGDNTSVPELLYSPSMISKLYSCRIPHRNSQINIFISILIANLVLLRAAWFLYNLTVGYFLKSRHPEAIICDECLVRNKFEAKEMADVLPMATAGRPDEYDENTIELNDLGLASPSARQEDRQSMQGLLMHRRV